MIKIISRLKNKSVLQYTRQLCTNKGSNGDDIGNKDKTSSESKKSHTKKEKSATLDEKARSVVDVQGSEVIEQPSTKLEEQFKALAEAKKLELGDPKKPKRAPSVDEPKNAWEIIKKDLTAVGPLGILKVPRESDVIIIGGGLIGCSVAFWIKARIPKALEVTVVEKDPTFQKASSVLSIGGMRTQFSCPENVQMSLASYEFMRHIKEHLSIKGMDDYEPPDINFNQQGYLFLASAEGAETMKQNHSLQSSCGSMVDLMTASQMKDRFPWINTDGIELASYGVSNEGWFDPWSLMEGLKCKAISLGARFIKGEVIGFEMKKFNHILDGASGQSERMMDTLVYRDDDNTIYPIRSAITVNAAGPWAADIAKMAGIGEGPGSLTVPLPVQPRKRYVYVVHCPDGPIVDCPLLVDNSGIYVRREGFGGNYICGASPSSDDEEPDTSNLDVDFDFFHEQIWPKLAHRIPAFEKLKVKSAWAGYYDYNYIDQNLIIGNHPQLKNFFFANGSSGHGAQHAIAIGRAISERILQSKYSTIDLSRFDFSRFMTGDLVKESAVV